MIVGRDTRPVHRLKELFTVVSVAPGLKTERTFVYRCFCGEVTGPFEVIWEHANTVHGLSNTTIRGRCLMAIDDYDRNHDRR